MKVVIVNEGLSYPANAGNWIRTLNLMLPLAKDHDITYLCRGVEDREAVRVARDFYADHGINAIITEDHPPTKRGVQFYGALAANLFSPLPYSIATHNSPAVRREIRKLAGTGSVDLWQFEMISYADAVTGEDPRTLVMTHNVESLIWQRMYETEKQPLKRAYIKLQWKKFERFEKRILRNATRVVAVSPEDAALLRAEYGVANPAVIDNGVDVAFFEAARDRSKANPKQILFLGSLEWRPNLDSLDVLLNQIYPQVLAQEPSARLCIVGRNPPAWLVKLAASTPNVELHANVPDVRPYLAQSGMLAVPLRIGGGSRLKILEAIAAGVPVVSTRVGCEGLSFRADEDLIVADSPDDMTAALLRCMRNPEWAAQMVERGRDLIEQKYDWHRLAARLEQLWLEHGRVRRQPVPAVKPRRASGV